MNQDSSQQETKFELMPPENPLEAIERAQIDVQISTAKKYPRVPSRVQKEIMSMATMDIETAEKCFYSLPRAGKNLQGGSIRLAEIALSCFGNCRAATRIVSTHLGDDPHVIVQAVCHDLEKNSAVCIEKRGRITGKKKNNGKPDDDDINLATNRTTAFALRDSIFKIVPKVLINPALDAAKRVAIGDASTLEDRRARAMESLQKMGVQPERVFAVLGKRAIEDIDLEDLETLTGLRNAVKDGETTLDEAFPAPQKENKGLFGKEKENPPTESKPADTKPADTKPTEAAKETKETKSTPLANDKTVLADWMAKNKLEWGQLQKVLISTGSFPFADSTGSFDDLTPEQCKTIFKARAALEKEMDQLPM